jgi:drug/metabolite transporter (DMT)-like permease
MFSIATLWIPFTITAALGQVARNAMQRSLTGPLGTWGATNIRFLFGFPFSILFFVVVLTVSGDHLPVPTASFWPWLLLGALSQIVATGLMLVAMNDRSFVVTTAYLKTEAIQTAIFGFVFLGDHLTVLKVIAIVIATIGVVITALRPGGEKSFAEVRPTIIGLVAAAAFALSAIGFRGAIITISGISFVTAASYTLVFGLFVQTLVLTIYLLWRAPDVLKKILGLWRPSMLAGFMGAFASQFWFLAFALTAAANVRTLALVEVLFAQAVAYYSFKQPISARELFGIVLIVIGVALLVDGTICRVGKRALHAMPTIEASLSRGGHAEPVIGRAFARPVGFAHPTKLFVLVAVFRQYRQRRDLDAFVDQRPRFIRRCLAIDRAVLDIAVMHLAGFIRKALADIIGVFHDVVAQLFQFGAQLALLRHQ